MDPIELYDVPKTRTVYVEKKPLDLRNVTILVVVIFVIMGCVVVFVNYFFGEDGVRLVGMIAGVLFILAFLWAIMLITQRSTSASNLSIMRATLMGIVQFQASDDAGEIRRMAAVAQAAQHDQNMLAKTMVSTARGMAEDMRKGEKTSAPTFDLSQFMDDGGNDDFS